MKLYSAKDKRYVERQIHFGVGNSVHTACGEVLYSRHVMVSIHSDSDGALITDDLTRVTCKRCLSTRDMRLRKLIETERELPGIFDRDSLCGEDWLLKHALDVGRVEIEAQTLNICNGEKNIALSNTMRSKDRKYIIRNIVRTK